MPFELTSEFVPTGDQPEAIRQLVEGAQNGERAQVLLGVTGSGKTFTMANVVSQLQRPTLVLTHNKTLVAQLYGEFKQFFPNNAVEYFVSYYDYYQPEAFIPSSNTYIEKDLAINEEIEKLRLRTTSSLMSGRRDVLVVASVSCIYGMGNPNDYTDKVIRISVGNRVSRNALLYALVENLYNRTTAEFKRGSFRVKGDTVDVYLAYADFAYRIELFGDEVERLTAIDPISGSTLEKFDDIAIFPANNYVTPKERMADTMFQIQQDMVKQADYFKSIGRFIEAKRLEDRVTFDLEMIRELGYCSGIENYSRYLDQRNPGDRPFCLLDYFPHDFLMLMDESHQTLPQLRAMYGGDRSRKLTLVEHGFRLPAALDNRPLKFEEFEGLVDQIIYVSATPGDYELQQSGGVVVEQLIRPTGLLDPIIEVRPVGTQVDDLLHEAALRVERGERVLVTTLTKRMAEELSKYMAGLGIKCRYIHSEVDTLDRVEILRDLRLGVFDVLIGVNLLREGLDLPEVSLVAVLDADKEGFLRSDRSLTQTAGRAARNVEGRVIFYADKITESMRSTMDETLRRRAKQTAYNEAHGITPRGILKTREEILKQSSVLDIRGKDEKKKRGRYYVEEEVIPLVADPIADYLSPDKLQKLIQETRKKMEKAAKELDFMEAARLRDEMYLYEERLKDLKGEK
jgi:excinuclease ABC subunit B